MQITNESVDALEEYWVAKARNNFLAYRAYIRAGAFEYNWFVESLASELQEFYVDFKAGKRPILLIQSPPQHGKSWSIMDFIAWISGRMPELRTIFSSYSDTLGQRCNLMVQRQMDTDKYAKIFPGTRLPKSKTQGIRRQDHLEILGEDGKPTSGQFRNTTVAGACTGESLDLGVIDDPVKGRQEAKSLTVSESTWEWFTDDFGTRFSDHAGLIIIMTRWTTHDLIGRLIEKNKGKTDGRVRVVNFEAIATKDEEFRKEGEALFPKLKSIEFLKGREEQMNPGSWQSLYQGNPTIEGGNLFKDEWWEWWVVLPQLRCKFITVDTAQKKNEENDWTVFQCWGYGVDDNIYLLDKKRERLEAPELRFEAEKFYNKHNTPRIKTTDAMLRAMFIEDKSSGTGLIQEMRRKKIKVREVPRSIDKILRANDAVPEVRSGKVHLNKAIPGIDNLTTEARHFPMFEFDDDIDCTITAIEVAYIFKLIGSSLADAMDAD